MPQESHRDLGRKGEAAFVRLDALHALGARLGFALVLSEYPDAREEVCRRLATTAARIERHPPSSDVLGVGFELARASSLQDESSPSRHGARVPVLWVEQAEATVDSQRQWREWLVAANRERENLHAAGNLLMVLAGPPELRDLVRANAPDLWTLAPPVAVLEQQPVAPATEAHGPIDWLHLSDLHLGRAVDWREDVVLAHLERDLPKLLEEAELKPKMVFVTGDLAWSGKADQYDAVHKFLAGMLEKLELDAGHALFLVPGNHDVDRNAIGRGAKLAQAQLLGMAGDEREDFREAVGEILGSARELEDFGRRLQAYSAFTTRLLGPARGVSSDRPFRTDVRELGGVNVGIASLASAWLCGPDEDKKGRIVLGERQVRDALSELESAGATFRIVLLHHPLEWLHEAEDRAVRELLANQADVVLHGHLHETDLTMSKSPSGTIAIAGAGAVYAGARWVNGFQAARFEPESGKLTLFPFKYVPRGGGHWKRDTDLGPHNRDGRLDLALRSLVARTSAAPEDSLKAVHAHSVRIKQATLRVYGRVDFVGLADNAPKPKTNLDALYVPAKFTGRSPNQGVSAGADAITLDELERDLFRPRTASELAARQVVLGGPGSGKSTLVSYVALKAAAQEQAPLPVVVRLREYVRQKRCDSLLSFVADECSELLQVPTEVAQLEEAAGSGQLLLLVDGLDEVVDEHERARVRDLLVAFANRYNRAPVLATSRIVGYDHAPLPPEQFARLQLQPFGDEEIRTFFARWYRIAEADDPRERERRTADLLAALEREPRAQALARVPLLAQLIALVHRYETNLPGERAALYDVCVKTLVVTWPRARGRRFTGLDEAQQRAVLEALALRLQEQRGADEKKEHTDVTIGRRAFEDALTELLADQGVGSSAAERRVLAEHWVEWLARDTGLVVEQQPGIFEFLHLSLLEFLAARALLVREGSLGDQAVATFIADHHALAHWQETCLLALGSESTRRNLVDKAVEGVLAKARSLKDGWDSWLFLLGLLREEVDVQPSDRTAILAGLTSAAADALLWQRRQASSWLGDILRFSRRHGSAASEWFTQQIERAAGDQLVGTVVLTPADFPLRAVLERRHDRRDIIPSLLDCDAGHAAGKWARTVATREQILAWMKRCPADLTLVRTLEGLSPALLDEPRFRSAYVILTTRALQLHTLVVKALSDCAVPRRARCTTSSGTTADVWNPPALVVESPFDMSGEPWFGRAYHSSELAWDFVTTLADQQGSAFPIGVSALAWGFGLSFPAHHIPAGAIERVRHLEGVLRVSLDLELAPDSVNPLAHAGSISNQPLLLGAVGDSDPWLTLSQEQDEARAKRIIGSLLFPIVAQGRAGIALADAAKLEPAMATALANCRAYAAWLWLYFEPLAAFALKGDSESEPDPTTVGLLLALGLRQVQTTWRWPWGKTWMKLVAQPAPADWFAGYWWHTVHALAADDPAQAAAQYASADACLDRAEWPELAAELRACRIIRTPLEMQES